MLKSQIFFAVTVPIWLANSHLFTETSLPAPSSPAPDCHLHHYKLHHSLCEAYMAPVSPDHPVSEADNKLNHSFSNHITQNEVFHIGRNPLRDSV